MGLEQNFACNVFTENKLKKKLSKKDFAQFKNCIKTGSDLSFEIADKIAHAMKNWAVKKGATHFSHWFIPLNSHIAEKHDAFLTRNGSGEILMQFSGKNLIKGEADASSFPCDNLRSSYEARGYTAWNAASPAFIIDKTLYIPSIFCSFSGESLDKKLPLLKSTAVLNKHGLEFARCFGLNNAKRVDSFVGAEQEYFLIDRQKFLQRPDLVLCGRTLFGAPSPKGQELNDHYYASIKENVAKFMEELDNELLKLGVLSATKHNEAAPSQHETAPLFTICNKATDDNYLTMHIMRIVAKKHGFACLLHEKPFEKINGSGKHNNFSIMTDTGINFFDKKAAGEALFACSLAAVVKGVCKFYPLLRLSGASASNDCRLGGFEAPPAIVSIYLGGATESFLKGFAKGEAPLLNNAQKFKTGVFEVPSFIKDDTDRNRTAPLAFTGNKFEFRMVGSSNSIAGCNTMINTIIANEMQEFCQSFAAQKKPIKEFAKSYVKDVVENSFKIVFSGDGYSQAWREEATRRGIKNIETTVDAIKESADNNLRALLTKHGIYSEAELNSRFQVRCQKYFKTVCIEAHTALSIAKTLIMPASAMQIKNYSNALNALREAKTKSPQFETLVKNYAANIELLQENITALQEKLFKTSNISSQLEKAQFCKKEILPSMKSLREIADALEISTSTDLWPMPTYASLLF